MSMRASNEISRCVAVTEIFARRQFAIFHLFSNLGFNTNISFVHDCILSSTISFARAALVIFAGDEITRYFVKMLVGKFEPHSKRGSAGGRASR